MTTGSGLYISPVEKDPVKQNTAIRQLIEGRSNAVGIVSLNATGPTTVLARNCSPSSAVFLFPASANAASATSNAYINPTDVKAGSFTVTHSAASNESFWWVCLG